VPPQKKSGPAVVLPGACLSYAFVVFFRFFYTQREKGVEDLPFLYHRGVDAFVYRSW